MVKIAPFDEHAGEYDAWFERHRESYLSELAAVREFFPVGGKGVEIGVGTGRFAGPLGIPTGDRAGYVAYRDALMSLGIAAWPLLYGMLVGTGIGGNITPVGATANVFACGILEKHGHKVSLKQYLKISIPFTLAAVVAAHILVQLIWL